MRLELWNGAKSDDQLRFLGELETLVETVETTPQVWAFARRIARRARAAGQTFQVSDLVVFSCASVHGLQLLHRDDDFDRLAGITP